MLRVDNKNYTYHVAPKEENEARKRLLGQTHASQSRNAATEIKGAGGVGSKSLEKKSFSSNKLPSMVIVGSQDLKRS